MSDEKYQMIDQDAEAEFIQEFLIHRGFGFVSKEDIQAIIEGQLCYLIEIGVAEVIDDEEG